MRRELLVRAPVRPRFLRQAHLLERHRQIEVRVGVERIEPQRLAVAGLRLRKAAEIVVDVAEVEVRLEEVGLEADRPLVERLRLDQLVAAVVDVREVDERGDEIRIELERLPIGRRRLLLRRFVAVVERGRGAEVLFGQRGIVRDAVRSASAGAAADGGRPRPPQREDLAPARRRAGSRTRADPGATAISARTMLRNDAPCAEPVVRLLDDGEIGKREERVGVGPQRPAAGRRISRGSAGDPRAAPDSATSRSRIAWYCRFSASGVGTPASRQNSSSVRIRIGASGAACAFSSSARFSLLLLLSSVAGPNPSAPTTSIVVFALTSSAVAPPRRATSARASLRPSELSFPVKTTSCPASG